MDKNQINMLIDGKWVPGSSGEETAVLNPANLEQIGVLGLASKSDLQNALTASLNGFSKWKNTLPGQRANILHQAANYISERLDTYATELTKEAGKPFAEAQTELQASIEVLKFYAEEGKRVYGRLVPPRVNGMKQSVLKEPIGPVIAFTAWNFPAINFMRKVAGALAAGCSIVIKPDEQTPLTGINLARAFQDAGLPDGVLNVVYGNPADVSEFLCSSSIPRKLSFTGSVKVGMLLSRLASQNLLATTMELGGHAPFIVFEDADLDLAAQLLIAGKFRNAGQVCVSPSRFYVQENIYQNFLSKVKQRAAETIRIGDGLKPETTMGPLINGARVEVMERLLNDALEAGSALLWQSDLPQDKGSFFPATILQDTPENALIMSEEPFGPIAPISSFQTVDEVLQRANGLSFGLAAYAFTRSAKTVALITEQIEAGMCAINSLHINSPETPFGGIHWSGSGSEGGIEGINTYLRTRLVTEIYN